MSWTGNFRCSREAICTCRHLSTGAPDSPERLLRWRRCWHVKERERRIYTHRYKKQQQQKIQDPSTPHCQTSSVYVHWWCWQTFLLNFHTLITNFPLPLPSPPKKTIYCHTDFNPGCNIHKSSYNLRETSIYYNRFFGHDAQLCMTTYVHLQKQATRRDWIKPCCNHTQKRKNHWQYNMSQLQTWKS